MLTLCKTPTVLQNPINWSHPRAHGLLARWLVVPGHPGAGSTWVDLCRGTVGMLSGTAVPPSVDSGWGATSRPGAWGELRFDGSNDLVTIGAPPHLTLTTEVTLAAWVKPTVAPLTDYAKLVMYQYDSAGSDPFVAYGFNGSAYLDPIGATGEYAFEMNTGGVGLSLNTGVLAVAGQWTHLMSTYRSGLVTIAVNGVLKASASLTGTISYGSGASLQMGGSTLTTEMAQISLDDVCIWGRALSQQECFEHYLESQLGDLGMLHSLGNLPWRTTGF